MSLSSTRPRQQDALEAWSLSRDRRSCQGYQLDRSGGWARKPQLPQSTDPRKQLARLEGHRAPLFIAAWEATRGDLTAVDLAKLVSPPVAASTINNWIRGDFAPQYDALEKIATALGRRDMFDWLREGRVYLETLRQTVLELERRAAYDKARDETLARAQTEGTASTLAACYAEMSVEDRKDLLRQLRALDRKAAADQKRAVEKP